MNLDKLCEDCAEPHVRPGLSIGLRRVLLLVFLLFMICGFAWFTAKQLSALARLKKARAVVIPPVVQTVEKK